MPRLKPAHGVTRGFCFTYAARGRQGKRRTGGEPAGQGIDIGISKPFTVTTARVADSKIIDQAWYDTTSKYEKLAREISALKGRMSKMIRGSGRHQKAAKRLRQMYKDLQNRQRHAERILAATIADDSTVEVVMERLSIGGMTRRGGARKRGFNRRFRFARLYGLKQAVARRCEKTGAALMQINPRYTSQRCLVCDHTARENRHRSDFLCTRCLYRSDADFNASLNITFTSRLLHKDQQQLRRDAHASGGFVSLPSSDVNWIQPEDFLQILLPLRSAGPMAELDSDFLVKSVARLELFAHRQGRRPRGRLQGGFEQIPCTLHLDLRLVIADAARGQDVVSYA